MDTGYRSAGLPVVRQASHRLFGFEPDARPAAGEGSRQKLLLRLAARAPRIRRSFFKASVACEKNEIQISRGPVALLRDNELSLRTIFLRQIRLVEIRPVDEQNHVRILLDRARLAQIGELRLALFALRRARQLAE